MKIPDFDDIPNEIALLYRQFWFFDRDPPIFNDDLRRLVKIASDEQIVLPKQLFSQYGEIKQHLIRLYQPKLFSKAFNNSFQKSIDVSLIPSSSEISDVLDCLYDEKTDASEHLIYFIQFINSFKEAGMKQFLSSFATAIELRPHKFDQYVCLYKVLTNHPSLKYHLSINDDRYVFPPSFTSALMNCGIMLCYSIFTYSSRVYIIPFLNKANEKLTKQKHRTMHQPLLDRLDRKSLEERGWEINKQMAKIGWIPFYGLTLFEDKLESFIEIYKHNKVDSKQLKSSIMELKRAGIDINCISDSLLDLAAQFGSIRCFNYLLVEGEEPGTKGIESAIFGGVTRIIQYYLGLNSSMQAHINAIDAAIAYRRPEIIEWLLDMLENDADVSVKLKNVSITLPSRIHTRLRLAFPCSYIPITSKESYKSKLY